MGEQVVGMYMPRRSERAERARMALARTLAEADVGSPDQTGSFDIRLDAADREQALRRVWNAIASAGVDEHIVFFEHADVPEHWRARTT